MARRSVKLLAALVIAALALGACGGDDDKADGVDDAIKEAVEKLFDVKVKSVNTLIRKGKVRIFKGRPGELQNTKRAMVTLEEGHRIDVTTGL